MFASQVKKVVDVPDTDPVVRVTIRKLNHRSLDKARQARRGEDIAETRSLGGDLFRAITEFREGKLDDELAQRRKDKRDARYREFDRDTVLQAGIESWTAAEKVTDGIGDLDEPTADFLFRAIVDLSAPAPAEVEEAQAKD